MTVSESAPRSGYPAWTALRARAAHGLRLYALEAKYEFFKVLRLPAYSLPTLAFPTLFYVMFSLAFGARQSAGVPMSAYMLATYGAFGVIGAALFGFGVGVAVERGQGWLLLKRASPMPAGAYFAAKVAMALLFATLIVLSLFALGAGLNGVRLAAGTWLALGAILVAGALPFCAMGLAFGTWCGPNSAPAVVNLVYLPMAFGSGLWMPVQILPGFLQDLAPALPPYHLAQLALKTLGADLGRPAALHVGALAAVTVLSLGLAWLGYRRDEGKTDG
jgi:ABC-2 type transport system permease protein